MQEVDSRRVRVKDRHRRTDPLNIAPEMAGTDRLTDRDMTG